MMDEKDNRVEARAFDQSDRDVTASVAQDGDSGGEALRLMLEGDIEAPWKRLDGIVTGHLLGFSGGGPVVDFPDGPPGGVPARTIVDVSESDAGREVALMFDGGCPVRPIIMGIIRSLVPDASAASAPRPPATEPPFSPSVASLLSISVDSDAVVLAAEREIVLRCGKASLTLTREGHIVLRGEYILSRASGVNRIKGGSVQIN